MYPSLMRSEMSENPEMIQVGKFFRDRVGISMIFREFRQIFAKKFK